MSEKHRALPSWMAKKDKKVNEKGPLKTQRKRKTARSAFYCMNEKELVEMAVSYLTNVAGEDTVLVFDQKVQDKAADTTVKMEEKPDTSETTVKPVQEALKEESSGCSDAGDETYVSETDLDITELETVQFTESQQHQEPKGQRSDRAQDQAGVTNAGLEAEKKQEHMQMPADAVEEDDSLCLVREIFFS